MLIRLLRFDPVVFSATPDGGRTAHYCVLEVPGERGLGFRGFRVQRFGLPAVYCVRVYGPRSAECECLGFLRHGYCRHSTGVLRYALETISE